MTIIYLFKKKSTTPAEVDPNWQEDPSPQEQEDQEALMWAETIAANKLKQEKLKQEREQINKSVLRSYRIKS